MNGPAPPILLVGPAFSQHVVRHANLLAEGGLNVHLVPMPAMPVAPDFSPAVTIHRRPTDIAKRPSPGQTPHAALLPGFGIDPELDVPWLAATIDRIRPALISSLTIQYGGYPVLLARALLGTACPSWIVGNRGAENHYWSTVPGQAGPIRGVMTGADYLFAICQRDLRLSREFGFAGSVVAVETPGGGWNLTAASALRSEGSTSSRRDLVIKGYDGAVGRALVALEAVEMVADVMCGRRLVILSPGDRTPELARAVGRRIGIDVAVHECLPYEDVLRALGQARAYVGLSLTDAPPTMALEAIVMGAFPILADTGAMEEVIDPGRSGLLTPAEDVDAVAAAIMQAMTDDRLVDQGVTWNDRFARPRFDANTLNPRIVAAYQRVIASRNRRGAVRMGSERSSTSDPNEPGGPPSPGVRPDDKQGMAWERLPARTLIVTPVAPPHDSGQAVVLDRLFRPVHPDDYRLLVFDPYPGAPAANGQLPLPARTVHVASPWRDVAATAVIDVGASSRDVAAAVARRARAIAHVAADQRCAVILATSGMLPSLPAAVLAGRLANLPVVIQMFDHWQLQSSGRFGRMIGRLLEPSILRAAAAVVVPNELLADAIHRGSGVRPVVVRNPIDAAAVEDRPVAPWPFKQDEVRLGYTGQVYDAQADALRSVVGALAEPGLERARLHVHAFQDEASLSRLGISGPVVVHPFVPAPAVYQVHRETDVLVLALAFGGVFRDIVRSSSTTKLADYLASGRPMLVHAPAGSFPAWYAARYGCGLVVDVPSPKAVARALRRLMDDPALRERLGAAGLRQARADFSAAEARRRLGTVLAAAVEGRCAS